MAYVVVDSNTKTFLAGAPIYNLETVGGTGPRYCCQIFTASKTYVLTAVRVNLSEATNIYGPAAGNVIVSIYDVLLDEPNGPVLDYASVVASTLPNNTFSYVNFTMTGGQTLASGEKYAIVISAPNCEPTNTGYIDWGYSTENEIGGFLYTDDGGTTWNDTWFDTYDFQFATYETSNDVALAGTITGTSSLSGILSTSDRIKPPSATYWYSTDGYYYRLWIQSDGSYGDHPPIGIENVDYEVLAGYLPNFINTNRRLIAATRNSIYYEDI